MKPKNQQKKTAVSRSKRSKNDGRHFFKTAGYSILLLLALGFTAGCFAFGIGAGYFASLVKDEPVRTYATMKKDLYDYEKTSKLYFANNEYIGDIRSDLHREKIPLSQIPDTLLHAVIATEDKNFYTHNGIMPKAIIRAGIQEVTNSETRTGGSTLTQQLIKNQILTNEVSFDRKAKEVLLALRVERFFKKDEILEAYLNIIPYGRDATGRNIAGIKTAANGIFGLEPEKLNLPQAAFLAGLPQSPSYYTPYLQSGDFKDKEGIQPGVDRMKYVLKRMYQTGYISQKELTEASSYDITKDFKKKTKKRKLKYPSLVYEAERRAQEILLEQIAAKDGVKMKDIKKDDQLRIKYENLADRALRQKGYRIHTTVNKKMYDSMEKVAKNYPYYGPDKPQKVKDPNTGKEVIVQEQVETGSVLIENKTGKILSFVGTRKYSDKNQVNYAMGQTVRPNGSTMKPLLDYAPAMEKGKIQPGSVLADAPQSFGSMNWQPKNYGSTYHGLVSARTALAKSFNIPAAEVYMKIIKDDPAKEFLEKMGITSLEKADHENPSLSLGQPERGISVEENTNAYVTFANGGKFVDAYMIDKITTDDGDIVYEHKPEPVKVFSPQTSYLMIDMMRDVLKNGTATYVKPQLTSPNVDWAGKTGTSQDYKDAWFVATNPNVTMGTWIGYKTPKPLTCAGCMPYSQRNEKLWAQLVNTAAKVDPKLVTPQKRFKQPKGIVTRSYCAVSGMLPSDACQRLGLVRSDIYNAKYVPTAVDDSLISGGGGSSAVIVNGRAVAPGPNTPREFITGSGGGLKFNAEFLKRRGYDKISDLSMLFPREQSEGWTNIGVGVAASAGSGSVTDTGKRPSAPGYVSLSGSTLTWPGSGTNVVGYRIYNSSYQTIGHTTGTSYQVSNPSGSYIVKAVDYFGRESEAARTN